MKRLLILLLFFNTSTIIAKSDTLYFTKDHDLCTKEMSFYYEVMPDKISSYTGLRFQYYSSNDSVKQFLTYSKGQLDGVAKEFYENTNKKSEISYKNNKIADGVHRKWYDNGQLEEEFTNRFVEKEKRNIYKIINFWTREGEKVVTNGNGYYIKKFDNGIVEEEGEYLDNHKNGEWKGSRNSGELYFIENYHNGVLVDGISYEQGDTTKEFSYTKVKKDAAPRIGMSVWRKKIHNHCQYNYSKKNIKNKIQGTVYLHFTIEKTGSISNIKVIEGVHPDLDRVAIKAISCCSWFPQYKRGQKIKLNQRVPITFNATSSGSGFNGAFLLTGFLLRNL